MLPVRSRGSGRGFFVVVALVEEIVVALSVGFGDWYPFEDDWRLGFVLDRKAGGGGECAFGHEVALEGYLPQGREKESRVVR